MPINKSKLSDYTEMVLRRYHGIRYELIKYMFEMYETVDESTGETIYPVFVLGIELFEKLDDSIKFKSYSIGRIQHIDGTVYNSIMYLRLENSPLDVDCYLGLHVSVTDTVITFGLDEAANNEIKEDERPISKIENPIYATQKEAILHTLMWSGIERTSYVPDLGVLRRSLDMISVDVDFSDSTGKTLKLSATSHGNLAEKIKRYPKEEQLVLIIQLHSKAQFSDPDAYYWMTLNIPAIDEEPGEMGKITDYLNLYRLDEFPYDTIFYTYLDNKYEVFFVYIDDDTHDSLRDSKDESFAMWTRRGYGLGKLLTDAVDWIEKSIW